MTSLAVARTSYWHDDLGLWEHSLSVTEDNPQAERALGLALAKADLVDDAVRHYLRAVRWHVDALLLNNLALAVAEQGKLDEAAALLERALELKPGYALTQANLGTVRHRQGKVDEALDHFRRAIALDPTLAGGYLGLAGALAERGEIEQALANCRQALELAPDDPAAQRLHQQLLDAGKQAPRP